MTKENCRACGHNEQFHCGAQDCPQPKIRVSGNRITGGAAVKASVFRFSVAADEVKPIGEPDDLPCQPPITSDRQMFLPCGFCGKSIGLRIVSTEQGHSWLQAAAGTWVKLFNGPFQRDVLRCPQCLAPAAEAPTDAEV